MIIHFYKNMEATIPPSAFSRYPSIKRATYALAKKFTAEIEDDMWVAMEKIHGANFGFRCTKDSIRLQRHNDFIGEGEKFHGVTDSESVVQKLLVNVRNLFNKIGYAETVIVFGELFGGRIQKEIAYDEKVRFECFDICIDNVLVSHARLCALCESVDIPYAAALRVDTLPKLVEVYNKVDIEKLHSKISPNEIAEGVVLRPLHRTSTLVRESNEPHLREILKIKRALFSERKPSAGKNAADLAARARDFVTPGRYMCVRSKFPEEALMYTVAMALRDDAMADIESQDDEEEEGALWSIASAADKKKILKAVGDAAFILVKKEMGLTS